MIETNDPLTVDPLCYCGNSVKVLTEINLSVDKGGTWIVTCPGHLDSGDRILGVVVFRGWPASELEAMVVVGHVLGHQYDLLEKDPKHKFEVKVTF